MSAPTPTEISSLLPTGEALVHAANSRLIWAAKSSDLLVMSWATAAGATAIDEAMCAACGADESVAAVKYARELGARNYEAALAEAARAGNLECVKLILAWGCSSRPALLAAAGTPYGRCLDLALAWGVDNSDVQTAIATAAAANQQRNLRTLRAFATKYPANAQFDANQAMLAAAASEVNCKEVIGLLDGWGATIHEDAFILAAGGHRENMLAFLACAQKRESKDLTTPKFPWSSKTIDAAICAAIAAKKRLNLLDLITIGGFDAVKLAAAAAECGDLAIKKVASAAALAATPSSALTSTPTDSPLVAAVRADRDIPAIREILDIDTESQDSIEAALMTSAKCGRSTVAGLCLDRLYPSRQTGARIQALNIAARNNHLMVAEAMLYKKSHLPADAIDGAINIATEYGYKDMVAFLVAYK